MIKIRGISMPGSELAFPDNPDLSDVYKDGDNYVTSDTTPSILRRYRTNYRQRKRRVETLDKNRDGYVDTPGLDRTVNVLVPKINRLLSAIGSINWAIITMRNQNAIEALIRQRTHYVSKVNPMIARYNALMSERTQRRQAYEDQKQKLLEAGRVLRRIYIDRTGKEPYIPRQN